ncbi:hypothetical protein GVN18_41130 [Pseudomonas sp. ODNR1LW]|nr:hypothetical protein [Pseudomonas sp. ODNR1LW]
MHVSATYDAIAETLKVEVVDSGVGFPQDSADALFERFAQADTSLTRKYGGSGLGLAMAKGLVELMGGSIWARSTPGEGSTFTFIIRLPIAER